MIALANSLAQAPGASAAWVGLQPRRPPASAPTVPVGVRHAVGFSSWVCAVPLVYAPCVQLS
jgi:hypothetical protein